MVSTAACAGVLRNSVCAVPRRRMLRMALARAGSGFSRHCASTWSIWPRWRSVQVTSARTNCRSRLTSLSRSGCSASASSSGLRRLRTASSSSIATARADNTMLPDSGGFSGRGSAGALMPALCLMISAGPSPPPPCGGRGWRGSASLLDVLEGEQAERILDETADLLAADVAEGAGVEVDKGHLVLHRLLDVVIHLLTLGRVRFHPRIRNQLLHLVVLVVGPEVVVGIVTGGEGHLLVRVD